MQYILVDSFNDTINIVCKEDGSGEPLLFSTLKEAEEALVEYCQEGIVVPMCDFIGSIKRVYNAIGMVKYELGEEWDSDSLEKELGILLGY